MERRIAALRRLLEVEQVTVEQLAIRSGIPADQLDRLLDSSVPLDDARARRLFASFGLTVQLEPLDPTFVGEHDRAAELSYSQRAAAACKLIRFATSSWNAAAAADG